MPVLFSLPCAYCILWCELQAAASECVWQHGGLPVLIQTGKYEWAGPRQQGDCSLRVLQANIAYDDGEWECQVGRGRKPTWEFYHLFII